MGRPSPEDKRLSGASDYLSDLSDWLRADPGNAVGYLNDCLDDEEPGVFLLALSDVANAYGGIGALAAKSKLNREHMFRMLSKRGNPTLNSLNPLLKALGFKLAIQAA